MAEFHPHSRFPPASVLVNEVIDHLKDDPKSLAACSLVCREWVKRSYYHRFERLTVSSERSKRIVSFGRNDTFSYVRMMKIIGDWNTKPEIRRALAILRAQSAPSTLILESANLITNASESITTSLPISAVDTLRLTKCNVHKSTIVFDVLSALPKLDHLHLHHIIVGQAGSWSAPLYPSSQRYTLREPHRLLNIEIASNTLSPYLEPLELVAPRLKLRSLNLGMIHVFDARRAGKFVETCTSLQDLTMTVAFLPSDFAALGLPVLTNLKTLHFIMSPPDLSDLLIFITHLLWNLPSVHMESITLKFLPIFDTTKKSVTKPSKPPPALPLLKKLEIAFNFESEVDHGWVIGLLKKQFSRYGKRGILLLKSDQQA